MTIRQWMAGLAATAALVGGALLQMGFVAKEGEAKLSGGCIGYTDYRKQASPRSFRAGDHVLIHGYNKGTFEVSDWIKVSRPEGGPKRWLHKRCFAVVTLEGQRTVVSSSILPIGDIEQRVRDLEEKSEASSAPAAPEAPAASAAPVTAPAAPAAPAASATSSAASGAAATGTMVAALAPGGDGEACMAGDVFPKRLWRSPEDEQFLAICDSLDRSSDQSSAQELQRVVEEIRAYVGSVYHDRHIQFVTFRHTGPGKSSKEIVEGIVDAIAPHATWSDLRESAFRHVLCGEFRRDGDRWTMEGGPGSGLHTRLRFEELIEEGAICQTASHGAQFGGAVASVSFRTVPAGETKPISSIDVDDAIPAHIATLVEFQRTVCEVSTGGHCRHSFVKREIDGEDYPFTVWCQKYSDGVRRVHTAYPRACPSGR